jgi:hypothetical protein
MLGSSPVTAKYAGLMFNFQSHLPELTVNANPTLSVLNTRGHYG